MILIKINVKFNYKIERFSSIQNYILLILMIVMKIFRCNDYL